MLTIVHGDDVTASRNFLQSIRSKLKDVVTINATSLDLTEASQLLESNSLFESSKTVIIEDLLLGKKSEHDKTLLTYVATHHTAHTIYLWEKKEIGKTSRSLFPGSKDLLFKLPQTLFQFLDSIKPNNGKVMLQLFHKTIAAAEAELVFYMLVRHVRVLLALQDEQSSIEEVKKLQSWQRTKLVKQSSAFTTKQLMTLHKELFIIDHGMKTGNTSLSLSSSIDILLLSL